MPSETPKVIIGSENEPILTREEVSRELADTQSPNCNNVEHIMTDDKIKTLNTITQAVELLRATNKAFETHPADEWYQEHYFTVVEDIEAFLARYDGEKVA